MNTLLLILFITAVILAEVIPLYRNELKREAAVLIFLGVITMVYGIYYINNKYTASLVKVMFSIFNIQ